MQQYQTDVCIKMITEMYKPGSVALRKGVKQRLDVTVWLHQAPSYFCRRLRNCATARRPKSSSADMVMATMRKL